MSHFPCMITAASTTAATSVSVGVLSKLDPKQVATLLKARGASEKAVANFLDNDITGKVIVDGFSDDDLNDLGFKTPVQRRGIRGILDLIISNGMCVFNITAN